MKFSLFELFYSRAVQGPLQMSWELWDEDVPNHDVWTVNKYIMNLTDRLKVCSLAYIELLMTQEVQKSYKKAKLHMLQPGQ